MEDTVKGEINAREQACFLAIFDSHGRRKPPNMLVTIFGTILSPYMDTKVANQKIFCKASRLDLFKLMMECVRL